MSWSHNFKHAKCKVHNRVSGDFYREMAFLTLQPMEKLEQRWSMAFSVYI